MLLVLQAKPGRHPSVAQCTYVDLHDRSSDGCAKASDVAATSCQCMHVSVATRNDDMKHTC